MNVVYAPWFLVLVFVLVFRWQSESDRSWPREGLVRRGERRRGMGRAMGVLVWVCDGMVSVRGGWLEGCGDVMR